MDAHQGVLAHGAGKAQVHRSVATTYVQPDVIVQTQNPTSNTGGQEPAVCHPDNTTAADTSPTALIFAHLPRNGGDSVVFFLQEYRKQSLGLVTHEQEFAENLRQHCAVSEASIPCDVLAHMNTWQKYTDAFGTNVAVFTLLREPLMRSYATYQAVQKHQLPSRFSQWQDRTFHEIIDNGDFDTLDGLGANGQVYILAQMDEWQMHHCLIEYKGEEYWMCLYHVAITSLNQFDLVLLMEDYATSMLMLQTWFPTFFHQHSWEPKYSMKYDHSVGKDLVLDAKLRQLNKYDVKLYEQGKQIFDCQLQQLRIAQSLV
jgi:hypothetical protein